ncbi:hypothetical protein Trydic_g3955 [Trypoxylus dichotomus]
MRRGEIREMLDNARALDALEMENKQIAYAGSFQPSKALLLERCFRWNVEIPSHPCRVSNVQPGELRVYEDDVMGSEALDS